MWRGASSNNSWRWSQLSLWRWCDLNLCSCEWKEEMHMYMSRGIINRKWWIIMWKIKERRAMSYSLLLCDRLYTDIQRNSNRGLNFGRKLVWTGWAKVSLQHIECKCFGFPWSLFSEPSTMCFKFMLNFQ